MVKVLMKRTMPALNSWVAAWTVVYVSLLGLTVPTLRSGWERLTLTLGSSWEISSLQLM